MANAGFDFLWIEMQHSPLTIPDATEGDIQKAVDIGALGIIVPMVASVAKVEAAVPWPGETATASASFKARVRTV